MVYRTLKELQNLPLYHTPTLVATPLVGRHPGTTGPCNHSRTPLIHSAHHIRYQIVSNISSHPGQNHIHRALAHIINLHNSGDNPEELALLKQRHAGKLHQLKRVLVGKQRGIHSDFICPPRACDSTQPEDIGYGSTTHKLDLIDWQRANPSNLPWRPDSAPGNRPYGKLSTYRNLCIRVMGKSYLYHPRHNPFGIVPEISKTLKRRCLYVGHDGLRCLGYSNNLVCRYHMPIVKHSQHLQESFISNIKSIPLKEAYARHLRDPAKKAIDAEIALMRTMLDALMEKVGDAETIKDMPFAHIIAVTKMADLITKSVERMAAIEQKMQMRVSVDQMNNFANNLLTTMVGILNPTRSQLVQLQEHIQKQPLFNVVNPDAIKEAEFYASTEADEKKTPPNVVVTPDGESDRDTLSQEEFKKNQVSKRAYLCEKHDGTLSQQQTVTDEADESEHDDTPEQPAQDQPIQ